MTAADGTADVLGSEIAHRLDAGRWARANRDLLAKILTEFMFEEMVAPDRREHGDGTASFRLALGDAELRFTGRLRALGHWRVDPATVEWSLSGVPAPLPDVAEVVALAAPAIGIEPSTAAGAMTELANTLVSDVVQLATGRPAEELVDLDPALLEGEMRGHPWIVANKGRLGFDVDDLARYAPEAQQPVRLRWLAARADRADARQVDGLDHAAVVRAQVGDDGWDALQDRAAAAGLDLAEVVYLPVHPWQWRNRIVPLHAGDLARGDLVDLGEAPPRYLPQQSIRTLADLDDPGRRTVKLALSILNTSVFRGIPRERALAAPALTEWFCGRTRRDPFLIESGLVLLGEVASVSVAHRAFEALPEVPYQHTEMLGAIFRESVHDHLVPGEQAVTLAALMHRDPSGAPYLGALIRRSGLSVEEWVERLHHASLPPLLHVLYRFGAAFSPHAQNCLLVLRDHAPVRLVVKDFVDDAMVSCEPVPELADLPPSVHATLGGGLEPRLLVQWIQGGLLVCVHRYVSEVLEDEFGFPEATFWSIAERVVRDYQDRFEDELGPRYEMFDMDAPVFVKLCLNRVRVLERGYADDAERPVASAVGWIDNPLALGDEVATWS